MSKHTTNDTFIALEEFDGLRVQATLIDQQADVDALDKLKFDNVLKSLNRFGTSLRAAIEEASPTKATVEIGVQVGVESGELVGLVVKGTGEANLKVTLEWEKADT